MMPFLRSKISIILLIAAFLSYILIFFKNIQNIGIPNFFPPIFTSISINIEPKNPNEKIFLKINNRIENFDNNGKILTKSFEKEKIKSIEILLPDEYKKSVKSFVAFNDIQTKGLSDEDVKQKPNDLYSKYYSYDITQSLKLNKDSKFINYSGNLNAFCTFLLSIFVNSKMYFVSILCLIAAFLFKPFSIKSKRAFWTFIVLIFLLSILIKLNKIAYNPLWFDEMYAVFVSQNPNFLAIFKDLGNPPFFYFLLKIFACFPFEYRILPFVFGNLTVIFLFFFLLKFYGKRAALFGLILSTFNLHLIYFSQELRCYTLAAFLVLICAYFYIAVQNDFKKYIPYAVFASLLINTHYFGILFVFSNFIYGILNLKNNKENLKRFVVLNLIILLTFLPYFLLTAHNIILKPEFNSWIPDLSFSSFINVIKYYFGGIIQFVLFSVFASFLVLKEFKKQTKKDEILNYILFSILICILFAIIVSIFRSVMLGRYFVVILPLYFICVAIFAAKFKKFGAIILLLFLCFSIPGENLGGKRNEIPQNIKNSAYYSDILNKKNNKIIYVLYEHTHDKIAEYPEKYDINEPDIKKSYAIYSYKDFNKDFTCLYIKANNRCVYKYEKEN